MRTQLSNPTGGPLRIQVSFSDLVIVARRRLLSLLFPPLLLTLLSVALALVLPREYESSTTIWVQRDEILNPLVSYSMAVQMASEDRLRTFNEIILSRQTIEMLIDTLTLAEGDETPLNRDELVDKVRSNINIDRRGSDSFSLTFVDIDPERAKEAVTILANHFILTRLQAENQRNSYTVQFFKSKLREYENKFQSRQDVIVGLLKDRYREQPSQSGALSVRLERLEEEIRQREYELRKLQRIRLNVSMFPEAFRTDRGRRALAELQIADLPYASQMRSLFARYDSVAVRYTSKHPQVEKFELEIIELLKRVRDLIDSQIDDISAKIQEERDARTLVVEELMASSVATKLDQEQETDYTLYRQMYSDMKVKYEQAVIASELGRQAQNQFIIIDPARVPAKPSRPNRQMIVLGGFALGLIAGLFLAGISEYLDSTVRSAVQLEVYDKPIIALLPMAGSKISKHRHHGSAG